MIQSVVLTVKTGHSKQGYDMELPANMKISELSSKLLEAMKNVELENFQSTDNVKLRIDRDNRYLSSEETLESARIWDGNTITVVRE